MGVGVGAQLVTGRAPARDELGERLDLGTQGPGRVPRGHVGAADHRGPHGRVGQAMPGGGLPAVRHGLAELGREVGGTEKARQKAQEAHRRASRGDKLRTHGVLVYLTTEALRAGNRRRKRG